MLSRTLFLGMSAANAKSALAYCHVWHEVNAAGQILGRLANAIAHVLQGKHKPIYHPKADCGDYVVVKNIRQVQLTGTKTKDKQYIYHTGYPGNLKVRPFQRDMNLHPESILRRAVYGMLPRAKRIRQQCMKRLFVFPKEEHPYVQNIFKSHLDRPLGSFHPLFK